MAPLATLARRLAGRSAPLWALFALLLAAPAWADAPGRVGRLADLRGEVWMLDAEQREWVQAQRNRPLTTGDRLSTERNGLAELQIGSGTLRLAGHTEVDLVEVDDDRVRIEVLRGSVALRLRASEFAREFELLTPDGRMQPLRDGHYRVDRGNESTQVAAWSGSLRFDARDSVLEVHDGQRAEFWRENGVTHYSWVEPQRDEFSDWAMAQDREEDRYLARRPYVSPEMTGGYELDRYGRWDRHPEYGTVWYPTTVVAGWAPYRFGHWAWVRPWGWTWVDDAPWGFAPFHYGRWAYVGSRWGWVPGAYAARPVYAPALVAWVGGSNVSIGISVGGGSPYVGWVPLAPRELYVPHYPVPRKHWRYVNPWHERQVKPVPTGPIMYTNRGVPGGVTVVPSDVLRQRQPISGSVASRVDPRVVRQVVEAPRIAEPPPRVVAVPGGAVPAAPGARAERPGAAAAMPRSPAFRDGDDGPPRGRRIERPAEQAVQRPQERGDRADRGDRGPNANDGGNGHRVQRADPRAAQPQGRAPEVQVVPSPGQAAQPRHAPPAAAPRAVPQAAPPQAVVPAPQVVRTPGPQLHPGADADPRERGQGAQGRGDERGEGRGEGRGDGRGNESRGNARERQSVK